MMTSGDGAVAILLSGGLDSAILLGESLVRRDRVHPLYVRCGYYWEEAERRHLGRFLEAIRSPALQPLRVLDVPVADLVPGHWGVTGRDVPAADAPDEEVFLPGRNVLLLGKAMLWCHLNGVPGLGLATLRSNPFPDATPGFFRRYAEAVNAGFGGAVRVGCPYGELSKVDVMRRGQELGLPLEHTFSCLRPIGGEHCGDCNKCEERRRAFDSAGMIDPTRYHAERAPAA